MQNPFSDSTNGAGNIHGFSFAPGLSGEEQSTPGTVTEGHTMQAEVWEPRGEETAWFS